MLVEVHSVMVVFLYSPSFSAWPNVSFDWQLRAFLMYF